MRTTTVSGCAVPYTKRACLRTTVCGQQVPVWALHKIIMLLGARLYASCFALLRVAFEAYVRGEWLALCTTDTQVQKFLGGWEPPNIDKMLGALARKNAFEDGRLSLIKNRNWKALCGYTHTGGIQVQRWNTSDGIEANYSTAELLEVLRFAEIVATLSVLGVLVLGGRRRDLREVV